MFKMCRLILLQFLSLHLLHFCLCGWTSDWMIPIQDEFQDNEEQKPNYNLELFEDEELRMLSALSDHEEYSTERSYRRRNDVTKRQVSTVALKAKLESTLGKATELAESLRKKILETETKEKLLKEAIVNGRSGVTSARVKALDLPTRNYIIRDGQWYLCDGLLQDPSSGSPSSVFKGIAAGPRCIGQSLSAGRDPCAYNSIIKYEVIPEQRSQEYHEEDHLCLKSDFGTALEQYLSVPKRILNDTCKNGMTRPLDDVNQECGVRTLTEYTFFPSRGQKSLPLEYCNEAGGACKLVIAWHVSNVTVENFEFLSGEPAFQKYFLDSEPNVERY